MISFSTLDIIIILTFFIAVMIVGFIPTFKKEKNAENYLLSGRKVGLILFILTNVATWYGGILGVGEFTYRYGLVSWFTQGLPYYFFAFIFAIVLAPKISKTSMFTIPEKIGSVYGEKIGLISALLIFILVSPAPYLLMVANLISLIFGIDTLPALFAGLIISIAYLFKGGYKSDLYTDALEFFIMFAGFAILFFVSSSTTGGYDFLESNLPSDHLSLTGNTSVTFLIVWFLIALWTFTDPGFHQRCYAAKTPNVAKYGILISIILWAVFDFLTTSTGLFARAVLPNLNNPVLAFPLLAERVLGSGFKGIFYAALFATILSTLNSFLFLSATTISRDFIWKVKREKSDEKLIKYTRIGLFLTGIISLLLAYSIQSVIEIWYTIGSICIPGIILLVFSSYFEKIRISKHIAIYETLAAVASSLIWLLIRTNITLHGWLGEIEPMIIGMLFASTVHIYGLSKRKTIAL